MSSSRAESIGYPKPGEQLSPTELTTKIQTMFATHVHEVKKSTYSPTFLQSSSETRCTEKERLNDLRVSQELVQNLLHGSQLEETRILEGKVIEAHTSSCHTRNAEKTP
uniref:Peroxin-14 n=1 Tax=Steinernema glaseri TaxID=37863 RepID=A0A1I8AKQ3_9BILA